MFNFRNIVLYLLYAFALAVIFLYAMFPSDTAKDYIAYQAGRAAPDVRMKIDRASPAFPPGLKMTGITVFQKNEPVVEASLMKVFPKIFTVFGEKSAFTFHGQVSDGTIKGKGEVDRSGLKPRLSVDADLLQIQLKGIKALGNNPKYRLSGILKGKVSYAEADSGTTMNSVLTISNCGIELVNPVFSVDKIDFGTIQTNIAMPNKNSLQVKECIFKGTMMSKGMDDKTGLLFAD